MKNIRSFHFFLNESISPAEEAQNILDDLLEERSPEELQAMTIEDALETVEAYGYEGEELAQIAEMLHRLAEGI